MPKNLWKLSVTYLYTYIFNLFIQLGSRRCHDPTEKTCLFSQLGSDPFGKGTRDGFLTQQNLVLLIRLASLKNIEIIPVINMGDSARAAIVASKNLNARVNTWLFDPDDNATYSARYPDQDSAINPCRQESVNFFEFLVKMLKHIYNEIAKVPLESVMVGSNIAAQQIWTSKHCYPQGRIPINQTLENRLDIQLKKVEYVQNLNKIVRNNGIPQMIALDDSYTTEFDAQDGYTGMNVYNFSRWITDVTTVVHQRMNTVRRGPEPEMFFNRGQDFARLGYKVGPIDPFRAFFGRDFLCIKCIQERIVCSIEFYNVPFTLGLL